MSELSTRILGATGRSIYGNSIADWLTAAAVAGSVWIALSILRRFVTARSRAAQSAPRPLPVRLLFSLNDNTKQFFILALAIYAGLENLTFAPRPQQIVAHVVLLLCLLQAGLWGSRAVRFYLETREAARGADRAFVGSLDIIHFVVRIVIWSLLILVALDNLGINITALLAGLGVGGVAVALALQNILGDLFASLSIALDKPFVLGDSLTIDAFTGAVEHIGIKTTRLRSESGEQIVLSNADILKSRVRNYGRMAEQRVLATLRVAYGTPLEALAGIPKVLEAIVCEQPHARFERCHLKMLADSALQFELAYFGRDPKINPILDLQHAVNQRILAEFRRLNIEFALPAQRIVLERGDC